MKPTLIILAIALLALLAYFLTRQPDPFYSIFTGAAENPDSINNPNNQ